MALFEAFQEVSTSRIFGMGTVGPVPSIAIEAYAERYGFSDLDDFDLLRRAIRAMDNVFLDDARSKLSKS